MHFWNKIIYGSTPSIIGQLSGAISAAAYNQEASLRIPFHAPRAISPDTTILNLNQYSSVTVFVKWKNALNIVDAENTLSNVVMTVYGIYREPISNEDRVLKRPELMDGQIKQTVAAANTGLQIPLDEDAKIKSILIMAIKAGIRSNALLDNIKVLGDGSGRTLVDVAGGELQSDNKAEYAITTLDTGIYLLDFDYDGDFDDMLNTFDMKTPKLECNVQTPSGVTQLFILQRRFVVPS